MEFCVEGDTLYYCDDKREAALYAYHMQTEKETLITSQQGFPYKTSHGCFYLVENQVYGIEGEQLRKLCGLPKDGEFYDYVEGEILLGKRNKFKDRYVVQEIFRQKKLALESTALSEDASEKLYSVSDTAEGISKVIQVGDMLYIGQNSGLYCVGSKEKEVIRIFDRDVMALYTDGGIAAYGISSGSSKMLSQKDAASYQDYEMTEFYGDYLILRHGYQYYFAVLDTVAGTIKRVVE